MQQRIKNYEETISTLINVNNKENIKNKLKLVHETVKERILPHKMGNNSYKLQIPTTDQSVKKQHHRVTISESK